MPSSPHEDELHRYIEYQQRQLLTPGWADFFDPQLMRTWLAKNGAKLNADLASQYDDTSSPAAHLENLLHGFEPKTAFDSPQTQAIFGPILEMVKGGAEEINIRVQRPIEIVTATNVGASAAAIPTATEGSHFLFVGLGTSSFCNYWAKAFTAIVKTLARPNPFRRFTRREDIEAVLKSDPSGVILAGRLALAYAMYGSLIGFGQIDQPPDHLAYRLQVLSSMEVFVVAHEFAHFVADEQMPEFRGQLDAEASHKLEDFCDQLALQISRHYANRADNFLSFVGLGGILFFRAMQISEYALEQLSRISGHTHSSSSAQRAALPNARYPDFATRVERLKSLVLSTTADDQRQQVVDFLEEYDLIGSYLVDFLKDILRELEP
jgi:hypothetical protein